MLKFDRRSLLGSAALILAGSACRAQTTILPGFPPGLFTNTAALGGGGTFTPSTYMSFLPQGNTSVPNFTAGSNAALQWERTQAWSCNCQIQVATKPTASGTPAAIIFTTCNDDSTFKGYEFWIDGTGVLRVRLINTVTTNWIDIQCSTNVCDGNWHNVAATYDGSSTAAGVKVYINGVAETITVLSNNLTATIVNAQPFLLGNQTAFPYSLGGNIANFQLSNSVRSQAYCAAYTIPAIDANVVLAYNFSEGVGPSSADLSSNGFTGFLTGSTWPLGRPNLYLMAQGGSSASATSYTFTSQFTGLADTSRVILVAITSRFSSGTTPTCTGVTIGGSSMTLVCDSRNTDASTLQTTTLWQLAVSAGNSGTVIASFSTTMAGCVSKVYSLLSANTSTIPSGAALSFVTASNATATASGTITVPTNGVALITGSIANVTGTIACTPTNYKNFGNNIQGGPGNAQTSDGMDSTAGSHTYTMTWTGTSPIITTGIFAAYGT